MARSRKAVCPECGTTREPRYGTADYWMAWRMHALLCDPLRYKLLQRHVTKREDEDND